MNQSDEIKRSSLSSRASKIPQKLVQASYFLRPSTSSLTPTPIGLDNERFTTRIGHMLWRQRPNESILRQSKSNSTEGFNDSKLIDSPSDYPPYSTSTPERTDFLYYSSKDENNPLFSPLSFTNSSSSSINESTMFSQPMMIAANNSQDSGLCYQTFIEFADDISDQCAQLLQIEANIDQEDINKVLKHVKILIQTCDAPDTKKMTLENQWEHISEAFNKATEMDSIKFQIENLQILCQNCLTLNSNSLSLCTSPDGFRKESPKLLLNKPSFEDYKSMDSDQIDSNANWFRKYFVGKPYITLIGPLDSKQKKEGIFGSTNSNGIISVIQERAKDFSGPGNGAAAILGSQYRIIIRSKETEQVRYIIHECMVKETQARLQSKGLGHLLDKPYDNPKRLRSFRSPPTENGTSTSRMLRAAVLAVFPGIDPSQLKELSAESTIMAGLEKDLLKYDEIQIPKHYKFGVLNVKEGQSTEEIWFSNTGLSDDLANFLDIMGEKIELKGYQGYAAGLDTKTGESGSISYRSSWNGTDIMFHVAPLMPLQNNDKQHIFRKKHIGNDIVSIIFIEGDQSFNPRAIRSQFLHVYIVIRPEVLDNKRQWRVEVLRNKNVCNFGPPLPCPPVFDDPEELRSFLKLKLISAENASLKSEKFFVPNNKARISILSGHVQTGLSFMRPEIVRSLSTTRLSTESKGFLSRQNSKDSQKLQRPKSVNNSRTNGGSRLLREAIIDEEKNGSRRKAGLDSGADIPPLPSISRSSLLKDFKNGFTRRKIQSNNTETKSRKQSSHLKAKTLDSVPESQHGNHASSSSKKKVMRVDLKLDVSTESFITDEQLFSPGAYKTNPTKNIISTIKSKNNVAVIGESDVKVFGKMSNDDLLFLT